MKLNLQQFNFRHLILGISALVIFVLTFLVALISAQIAFNEMSDALYKQSILITKNLAEDSIVPLLFDNASGAEDMLDTLVDMQQITDVAIIRASKKTLVRYKENEHVDYTYPTVNQQQPFKFLETKDGWYFSALISSSGNRSNNQSINFFDAEETNDAILGYVNLGVSKVHIYTSRKSIFIQNFIISTIAGILLLVIMYQMLRTLTQPLEKLSILMEQGRKGNYNEVTSIKGTKEIVVMSRTFNAMIDAIKEREENLSLTLDSIGDAVIATDNQGKITRMNPVAEQLTGWTLAEASGEFINKVFPIVDASTRKSIKNPVEKVLDAGETVYLSNHTTLISRDKTEYQIADSAAPIRHKDGSVLGMVLVFNDVTEQYKLRQQAAKSKRDMQAIMDNSPAVIYIKDFNGCYLFVNKSFEKLFNYTKDNILGKTDHDLFPADIADTFRSHDVAVIKANTALESEELAPHDDGLHTYLTVKFPLIDNENKAYAICGVSNDITDRRKQNEQLRQAQKMNALGELTGGVAHDYNNMLAVVMGYAEILKDGLGNQPKFNEYAQQIFNAAERGTKLTKKLLSFSRKKTFDNKSMNINDLLRNDEDMLQKTITARIKLIIDLQENLYPVWLDNGDMEEALVNLCINAKHAMDSNGMLSIKTYNQTLDKNRADILHLSSGDYVVLSITDTGCGMDTITQQKIFEPFYSTKGDKGTGLGLSQVYGFVERSNGAIQVDSALQQGTQFSLYFPRYFGTDSKEKNSHEIIKDDFNGNDKILVVDDESALLNLTCEILKQHGYEVLSAESATAALHILEQQSVDVMLSDIIMPEMDGYQLAKRVQEKYPAVKIQLVSGFADERNSHLVDESLVKNILNKPVVSTQLLQRIKELLS